MVVRDERPWDPTAPPAAFYRYSADRKGEHAQALLGSCRGFLHADAYAGFEKLYVADPGTAAPRLVEVACWAHARRSLYEVFDDALARTSTKSKLAVAIRYSTARWPALTRYTTDGRLEICNNAAERAIRPLALGRRNWTFAGSDAGGRRAAAPYTIIETAKMSGLDVEAYLADVVARIADHPINRIDELLPWHWRPLRQATPAS